MDVENAFNGIIGEQINVLKCQEQASEILFKTRQFVADASPKSRSMMMIFIDSNDLLEQVMSAHQDYKQVHIALDHTGLLDKIHDTILFGASELERVGLIIQSGAAVRDDIAMEGSLKELDLAFQQQRFIANDPEEIVSLHALGNTIASLRHISALMQRLVRYSRLEVKLPSSYASLVEANRLVVGQPVVWETFKDNLTLKSNTFRHAVRLTVSMLIGYALSNLLSLNHAYWVLLTIVTILKPVYSVSRQRNIQRLTGTLLGALLAAIGIYFISDRTILLALMIFSMIMSYRVF